MLGGLDPLKPGRFHIIRTLVRDSQTNTDIDVPSFRTVRVLHTECFTNYYRTLRRRQKGFGLVPAVLPAQGARLGFRNLVGQIGFLLWRSVGNLAKVLARASGWLKSGMLTFYARVLCQNGRFTRLPGCNCAKVGQIVSFAR